MAIERVIRWKTSDGQTFCTKGEAEDRELVLDVATVLRKAAEDHGLNLYADTAAKVAEVLVMTDVFRVLKTGLLKDIA